MVKILFICHGNICRSPMAEFVMKKLVSDAGLEEDFFIDSAATSTEEIGNGMHRGTLMKLQEKNIPYTNHRARQITAADYEKYDLLIGMDSENLYYMKRRWGTDPDHKIHLLMEYVYGENTTAEVADPWYTGNFDETYRDVEEGCAALLRKLSNNLY